MTKQIQSILVAYDFCEGSVIALKEAFYLADKLKATISLIHVMDANLSQAIAPKIDLDWKNRLSEDVHNKLGSQAAKIRDIIIELGEPYECIANHALNKNIDLIVLGSSGHSSLGHAFLGSVADKVIRFSPCPTLICHQDHKEKLHKILLPLDEFQEATPLIPMLEKLSQAYGANTQCMHSVDTHEYYSLDYQNVLKTKIEKQRNHLNSVQKKLTGREPIIIEGSAAKNIVRLSKEDPEIDLIVMASHGQSGLKEWLLGSTTEKVARHAHCNVLVVPVPRHVARLKETLKKMDEIRKVSLGNVLF